MSEPATKDPQASTAPKPPGTSLRELRGPKADVIAKILALDLPAHLKTYLEAEVNARQCDGVAIDVHFADEPTLFNQHITIRKLY